MTDDWGLLEQAEELDKVVDVLYNGDMLIENWDIHEIVECLVQCGGELARAMLLARARMYFPD